MNDKCSSDIQQADCCDQQDCCPSSTCGVSQGPTGGRGWWKTAVFTIVMLLVAGMVAYSILTPESDAASTPAGEVSEVLMVPVVPDNAPGTRGPTLLNKTASASDDALASLVDGELTSLYNLDGIFPDHDFVFVLLSGDDNVSTTQVARLVVEAAAKIQAQNVGVGIFTLSPDNPEFGYTVDRLSIPGLPAVLALSDTGSIYPVIGEITETSLLQTYLGSCGTSSSCPPSGSSSSSCCP